jgi:hypothetical protein
LLRDAQIEPAGHREGRNHNDFRHEGRRRWCGREFLYQPRL